MELVRHLVVKLMINNVIISAKIYLAWITKLHILYLANRGNFSKVGIRGSHKTRPDSIRISQYDLQIKISKLLDASHLTTSYETDKAKIIC